MVFIDIFRTFFTWFPDCFKYVSNISNQLSRIIIKSCYSDSSAFYHSSCTSVMPVIKSYHYIFQTGIKFTFPNIIFPNICQFQTSLTQYWFVKILLLTISYKLHPTGNAPGVFGVLAIIGHKHS